MRERAFRVELAVTSLFTLWLAWPFVRFDRYVVGFDTVAYSGPNFAVTRRLWGSGLLPQWNDAIFGGVVHLANAQTGVLYLPKLLASGSDINRAMGWLVALHLLALSLGMVVLMRRTLRLRAPAGAVAGIALVGSGPIMAKSVQFEQILVLGWAPWIVIAAVASMRSARPGRAVAALALCASGALSAGHPQMWFVVAALSASAVASEAVGTRAWRPLWRVAAGGALGMGLAAAAVVPALMANGRSVFADGHGAVVVRNPTYSVDVRAFPQSLLGDLLSKDAAVTAKNFEGVAFVGAAVGMLALLAVVAAVTTRRNRTVVAWWAVTATVGVWLSMGPRFGLYRLAELAVPGLKQARVPARWVVVWAFAVAVLAGLGADAIRAGAVTRRVIAWSAGICGAAAVAVCVSARATLTIDLPPPRTAATWVAVGVGALGLAFVASIGRVGGARLAAALALGALGVGELATFSNASFARHLTERASVTSHGSALTTLLARSSGRSIALTDDRFSDTAYLVDTLRPNANALLDGVRSFDGYDGGLQVTKRWVAAARLFTGGSFEPEYTLRGQLASVDASLAARFGIRWAMVETASRTLAAVAPGWSGPVLSDGSVVLLENPAFVGDAVLWRSVVSASSAGDAAAKVASAPDDAAVVEGSTSRVAACAAACGRSAASMRRLRSGSIEVRTSAAFPAVLSVDECWDPGWRVRVDGRSRESVVVNVLQEGVVVPAGKHVVRFDYETPSLRPLMAISALSLLVCLALLVGAFGRSRPSPADAGTVPPPGAAERPLGTATQYVFLPTICSRSSR